MKKSKDETKYSNKVYIENSYCLFSHSYVIEQSDKDEWAEKDRMQYESDKKNEDCSFAQLIDLKRNLQFIWDGKEESIISTKTIDCDMIAALKYLNSNAAKKERCSISEGYDYAWIKLAIDKQQYIDDPMQRFNGYKELINYSYKDFVDYVKSLGFDNICGSRNLERYYNYAEGRYPNFTYKDCMNNKGKVDKRNEIIKAFVSFMKALKKSKELK